MLTSHVVELPRNSVAVHMKDCEQGAFNMNAPATGSVQS